MSFKSRFYHLSLVLGLALSLSIAAFADTIRLKDGSIIKGKIVSFGDGKFVVVIDDGARRRQMIFSAAEVESISFDAVLNAAVKTPPVENGASGNKNNAAVNTNNPQIPVANPPERASVNSGSAMPSSAAKPLPITINVKVLADNTSNGWTNSGFVVRKGQRIRISSSGRISLGDGRYATPEGISTLNDAAKLMQTEATGGLIAVVGDDNNDFIFVGGAREFVAARDGALFLGVNEGNLNDNSGAFDVKIEIEAGN